MANKLDRFTQRARRVLAYAQEEAERLNHSYIGTEHLLLGLLREESGVAGKVLRDLNVQPERVTELVERITGPGRRTPFSRIDLTPRTRRVIELAVDEARRLGQHYIGTEHLLLGLIRQGDGVAIEGRGEGCSDGPGGCEPEADGSQRQGQTARGQDPASHTFSRLRRGSHCLPKWLPGCGARRKYHFAARCR